MKKDFDDLLAQFTIKKIKELVRSGLCLAPDGFWVDPASRAGKHPPENRVEGGIVIHTRKLVKVAIDLFRIFEINDILTCEKIIAACILHDIYKKGNPWKDKTDYTHGFMAFYDLMSLRIMGVDVSDDQDLVDVVEMVRNHMAIWNKPEPTPSIVIGQSVQEKDVWHLIVQLSDYWASRGWCSFVADEIDFEGK